MFNWLSNFFLNVRAVALALLVHILLFSLIGLNLNWNKNAKVAAVQPIQAVAIIEPKLIENLPKPEPVPEPVPQPIPEPIPEPAPEPIVIPKPKPVKTSYAYSCLGKTYQAESEAEADALKAECEEKIRKQKAAAKKKAEEEKKKAEKAKKDKAEKERAEKEKAIKEKARQEKRKAEALKKKRSEEKKKLAAEAKKKVAQKAAKKAAIEKKQREAVAKKEKARKQAAAVQAKAKADKARREQALLDKIEGERIAREGDLAWVAAIPRIKQAINNEFTNSYPQGLHAYYTIHLRPGGHVVSVLLTRSSGDPRYDEEVRRAILKASPLPIPINPKYFESAINYDHLY